MQSVILKELELEAFKSFVKLTKVEFSTDGGFKFLGGNNIAEPRLGANGAGKTSLWDGAVWALYGTSIKGLKASDLVSWGEKRPYGGAIVEIDEVDYHIERWGSPEVIQVDGEKTDQRGIDLLLGLSKARFLQSVIFGQGVPFFIDLSVPDRGKLLDEVLDLGVWLQAGEVAGKRCGALEKAIDEVARKASYAEGKIAGLPDLAALEAQESAWAEAQAGRLEEAIGLVEQAEMDLGELAAKVEGAKAALAKLSKAELEDADKSVKKIQRTIDELSVDYKDLHRQAQATQKEHDFLVEHANCPTCRQKYPPAERAENKRKAAEKLVALKTQIQMNGAKANAATTLLEEKKADYEKLSRKREFQVQQVANAVNEHYRQDGIVASLVAQAERIGEGESNPFAAQIAQAIKDRADAEDGLAAATGLKLSLQGQLAQVDYWRNGFKRVRLFMVKRILSHLEIEVANAAEILGLSGWKIEFVTETETRSGTLKQGVQVRISSPLASAAWESWSGGEGQRIRLAVALGFASMVQRMGGVDYGFEVWDEPSAWLSPEGIEDLLECLKYRAETAGKSVWLLDHRALIHSGFNEIWAVSKDADGSRVELISKLS